MKIAICGAHAVGKTTLAEVLESALPGLRAIEEPYHALVDDGYVFETPPGVEDFEAQLNRSLSMMDVGTENVVFDRAPADFLGYLAVVQRREGYDAVAKYWDEVASAMKAFDLIVYVPIEPVDRIEVPRSEYPRLRKLVDQELRRLLMDNDLGVSEKVMDVRGSIEDRVHQILDKLSRWQSAHSDSGRVPGSTQNG